MLVLLTRIECLTLVNKQANHPFDLVHSGVGLSIGWIVGWAVYYREDSEISSSSRRRSVGGEFSVSMLWGSRRWHWL